MLTRRWSAWGVQKEKDTTSHGSTNQRLIWPESQLIIYNEDYLFPEGIPTWETKLASQNYLTNLWNQERVHSLEEAWNKLDSTF